MANKLKKPETPKAAEKKEKVEKINPEKLKTDREEKVDFKKLARDERTWKIIGTVSLLVSIFLFFAFVSYLFTWKEDQDQVLNNDASFLLDSETRVSNLLGRLGAYVSHFFIYRGFGISSLLFCTFFFIVGINLLFERKVFSIWRNLRYITIGLLIASVSFSFLFSGVSFPLGGRVGDMISNWMINFLGMVGTAAVLTVLTGSYLIWQFNPSFKFLDGSNRKPVAKVDEEGEEDNAFTQPAIVEANNIIGEKGNYLKGGDVPVKVQPQKEEKGEPLSFVQKQEPEEDEEDALDAEEELIINQPLFEKEMVDDILHKNELPEEDEVPFKIEFPEAEEADEQKPQQPLEPQSNALPADNLKLEIFRVEDKPATEIINGKEYSTLPPYEPTLDLRDYKYPGIDLLEAHGSEKIVQDASELETNKNQIITTLKNYDITIQRISATVGPTVTLYEIVPAAGVRISRIKNLEDDIALKSCCLRHSYHCAHSG